MKRTISLAAALLAILAIALPVQSSITYSGTFVRAIPQSVSADDSDVAMVIRYIGAPATSAPTTATVTVGSNGDLTFLKDGSAVTEFECPVSGALGGVIDVSDSACNTLGEVVDIINASTNWRAVILDGLRADDMNMSGNGALLAQSTVDAKVKTGFMAYYDTDTFLTHSRALGACRTFDCLAPAGAVPDNRWKNQYQVLKSYNTKSTYGSGSSAVSIYSRKPSRNGETTTLLFTAAGGATTVYSAVGASTWPDGLIGPPDEQIVFRLVNTAAMASTVTQLEALQFKLP